jgi:Holliday junction resolvasome RuvABC endonuclease subunit
MEWYIIAGLLIILLATLAVKNPSFAMNLFKSNIMIIIKSHEAQLVQAVHSALPKEIKNRIDSKDIADVVAFAILMIGKMLKDK